jgi:hypothetical protein
MPQIIEHIDAIARQKKRDVLFVIFHRRERLSNGTTQLIRAGDWRQSATRKLIIEWLDAQGIVWEPCGHVANLLSQMPYLGQIYIDIPFDMSSPQYQRLASFLEHPDGTMKLPGATFCALSLEAAMKNAEHDEPGFWDRNAEKF